MRDIPVFWKTVIGVIGSVLILFGVLFSAVWLKGGSVKEILGDSSEEVEVVENIEDYEEKELYMEYSYDLNEEPNTVLESKPDIFSSYVIEYPEEIQDGLYVMYSPSMMDSHKIEDVLPRYVQQESAYPTYVFYMGDSKSAVIGYQIFADVSGKEFSEDIAAIYLVKDGKIDSTYTYPLYASELPTMD